MFRKMKSHDYEGTVFGQMLMNPSHSFVLSQYADVEIQYSNQNNTSALCNKSTGFICTAFPLKGNSGK